MAEREVTTFENGDDEALVVERTTNDTADLATGFPDAMSVADASAVVFSIITGDQKS